MRNTSLAARETPALLPLSHSCPYPPAPSLLPSLGQHKPQENNSGSAEDAWGEIAQFAEVSKAEIVSRLESPPLILHLIVKVQLHSRSPFEEGNFLRLLRADKQTPVVLHRSGGGAGVNLFALQIGSLIITNCLSTPRDT